MSVEFGIMAGLLLIAGIIAIVQTVRLSGALSSLESARDSLSHYRQRCIESPAQHEVLLAGLDGRGKGRRELAEEIRDAELKEIDAKLAEIERRQDALEEMYEVGSIGESTYRDRAAELRSERAGLSLRALAAQQVCEQRTRGALQ